MNLIYSYYDIIDFPNESIIVSSIGVSKIASPKLLNALQELKKQHQTSIAKAHLDQILLKHELPQPETLLFLQSAIGLNPEPSDIYFKKTLILHDWEEKTEFEKIIEEELTSDYLITEDQESLSAIAMDHAYFICIICMRYDYQRLKKLYFDLADSTSHSAISVAYLNGNIFRIDQPYMPGIGNPCHFCLIDRQLNYEKCSSTKNSWSSLLKFCMERNTTLPVQKLSLLQRSLAIGAIIKKIKLHTENGQEFRYQDNSFSSMTVDLNSGLITEEPSPHWHSCNCLRSKNEKYTA